MKQIEGIEGNLSINEFIKVSDLIYFDGPFLSHYVHKSGDNYLSYWVDCDDTTQRWLVFRVGIVTLQRFVNRKQTLFELMRDLDDGFVYLIDVDNKGFSTKPLIVFYTNLPDDYLPDTDSYYDFSYERKADVESLSLAEKRGLFEIHFSGNDIKYGNMPFDKYTKCLLKIEELRQCCANGYIKKVKTSETFKHLKSNEKRDILTELKLNTTFQYVYSLAGSVRVLLCPQNLQISFEQTSADDFAKELIRLFKSGSNVEELRQYAAVYGQEALIKFNELLEVLLNTKVDLEVSWTNKSQNIQETQIICQEDKRHILANLSQSIENTQELKFNGKFYSLNTRTGAFDFETIDDNSERISGKFDKNIIEIIQTLTFEQVYEICVERKIKTSLTNSNKTTDTIIDINSI